MKKTVICLFTLIILSLNVFGALPNFGDPYTCTHQCKVDSFNCERACANSYSCDHIKSEDNNYYELNYLVNRCHEEGMKAAAPCKEACFITGASCLQSCKNYENTWGENRIDPDDFRELEKTQQCDPSEVQRGCCPGYSISKYGVCCPEGYEALKGESGSVYCSMTSEEKELAEVIINVAESSIDLKEKNTVEFEAAFKWKDEEGKTIVREHIPYPGKIVVEPVLDSHKGTISFDVTIDNPRLDSSGKIKGYFRVGKVTTDEPFKNGMDVLVYTSEHLLKDHKGNNKVHLKFPKIEIISLKPDNGKLTWQESKSAFTLTMYDHYNVRKKVKIFSPAGNFEYKKVDNMKSISTTTKEETVKFLWKAPKISKEMRVDAAKRLVYGTVDMAAEELFAHGQKKWLEKLEDKKTKLEIKKRLFEYGDSKEELERAKEGLDNLDRLKEIYDNSQQGVDMFKQTGTYDEYKKKMELLNSSYNDVFGERTDDDMLNSDYKAAVNERHYRALKAVYLVTDEVLGFLPEEASKAVAVVKLPLKFSKKVFEIVDDMRKVGHSKVVNKYYPVYVTVDSKHGHLVSRHTFGVEGYEFVLHESEYDSKVGGEK